VILSGQDLRRQKIKECVGDVSVSEAFYMSWTVQMCCQDLYLFWDERNYLRLHSCLRRVVNILTDGEVQGHILKMHYLKAFC
jgi:hypothetical protein